MNFRTVTFLAGLALVGCSTKQKLDTALDNANKTTKNANELIDEYKKLAKETSQTLADMRASAKTVVNTSPAKLASAPALPPKTTGGVDINASMSAKTGKSSVDVDGTGTPEDVEVLAVDDAQVTTQGPSTSAPSEFISWKGDAESGDEGSCYLAWSAGGQEWFVVSNCGDSSGAFVCNSDETTATCQACNTAGNCNPCDMTADDFTCVWPK